MTCKEAIEWINARMCIGRYHPSKRRPLVIDECFRAGQIAIKALKKQIPTKARIDVGYNIDTPVMIIVCPTCGQEFGFNEPKFCENCGQAIDWEEEE